MRDQAGNLDPSKLSAGRFSEGDFEFRSRNCQSRPRRTYPRLLRHTVTNIRRSTQRHIDDNNLAIPVIERSRNRCEGRAISDVPKNALIRKCCLIQFAICAATAPSANVRDDCIFFKHPSPMVRSLRHNVHLQHLPCSKELLRSALLSVPAAANLCC
jgi:hypothetical protein